MAVYAYAEIVSAEGNLGAVSDPEEAARVLRGLQGRWAVAVAAGNADEPMRVVMAIDPDTGEVTVPG